MDPTQQLAALKELQTNLNAAFDDFYKQTESKDAKQLHAAKQQLLALSSDVANNLVPPVATIWKLSGTPLEYMAVRIAVDFDVFVLAAKGPTTVDDITKHSGADPTLIKRILRLVSALGYLKQTAIDTWTATPLTHVLTIPGFRDWTKAQWDGQINVTAAFPDWLREREWKTSWEDDKSNVFMQTHGLAAWQYYAANPKLSKTFDSAMSIQEQFPPEMTPFYPFEEKIPDIHGDGVTLVDVGGGLGQALVKIRNRHPNLPGRFVLQDLAKTIDTLSASQQSSPTSTNPFEPMVYDFFTPQPIKGAKFYHLRRVLHDWNDEMCLKILASQRPALVESREYSRLLIEDFVLPDVGCGSTEAVIDLVMMTVCDGKERTRTDWEELLGKAGFRIVNIWPAAESSTAVIEAEVA